MPFRLHFTVADLARTRIVDAPNPLAETILAARGLCERELPGHLRSWRRQVVPRLTPRSRLLLDLTPARGYTPSFLDSGTPADFAEQLDVVRATPRHAILRDLAFLAGMQRMPGWARRLADDPETFHQLVDSVGDVYRVLVAPYWREVTTELAADRAVATRDFLDGGVERLLSTLDPQHIRWEAPVLAVRTASNFDEDVHLEGRGLLLFPSVFGSRFPTIDLDGPEEVYVTYPVRRVAPLRPFGESVDGPAEAQSEPVAGVLGRTRAAILTAIAERPGCTTTELARTVNVSLATASEHAAQLRGAGLITTVRQRQRALHVPTRAGAILLGRSA